ncbi:SH3 domain-containing protein [Xanthomonas sp. 60]
MSQTKFVSTNVLNQRSTPNGKVVGKLAGGDPVVVYERQGEWTRVSPEGTSPRWVSSKLLCNGSGCYQPSAKSARSRERSRPVRSNPVDAGCPCSGSRICIGPRGGRYCITSGGNKRYGV